MKSLEENRYKKIYNADARRVAWLVNNNLAEDYDKMPKTMRKKWSKATYGRERYLANEYINQRKSQMNEQQLRKTIREILEEGFSDGSLTWEETRQQQSEVLGYKLTGKADHRVKPAKLVKQEGNFKNESKRRK